MRKILEILRLNFESQLGKRQISRSLDIAHSTVYDTAIVPARVRKPRDYLQNRIIFNISRTS
jgi:hypothetical protein